jgi:hypothetical protein
MPTLLLKATLLLFSLLRKKGITVPKLESSKYWDTTMAMLNKNPEFNAFHYNNPLRTNWKSRCMENGGIRAILRFQSDQS